MDDHGDEEAINAPLIGTQADSKNSLWARYVWRNGVFLVALSTLSFSSQLVFVKKVENKVPEVQVLWARGAFVCLGAPLAIKTFKSSVSVLGKRENMHLLVMLGVAGFIQLSTGWASIQYIPIAECLAILFSNSIVTALVATIFGLDKWSPTTPIAVVLCVVGVALVTRPAMIIGNHALDWDSDRILGLSLAAGSAIFFTVIYLISRKLKNLEGGVTLLYWQSLVLVIVSTISLAVGVPAKPVFQLPFRDIAFLVAVVLLGSLAWFLLYRSVQLTSATLASVMGSLQLLWSFLFDILFFGEPFSLLSVVGSLCVVGASAIVALSGVHFKRTGSNGNQCSKS